MVQLKHYNKGVALLLYGVLSLSNEKRTDPSNYFVPAEHSVMGQHVAR